MGKEHNNYYCWWTCHLRENSSETRSEKGSEISEDNLASET